MTPAMQAVLQEEWHSAPGINGPYILNAASEVVGQLPVFVSRESALSRALLMANALRMVRLLQTAAEWNTQQKPFMEWCRVYEQLSAEATALLRDLGIEPEPAEAG